MITIDKKNRREGLKDMLYADIDDAVKTGSFVFDNKVANSFEDMARRSIPGYDDIQKFIARYALDYVNNQNIENACVLDVGASLGRSIISISEYAQQRGISLAHVRAHAIDYSKPMVQLCKNNIREYIDLWKCISCEYGDISDERRVHMLSSHYGDDVQSLCVVIMNFVLQFIPMDVRNDVLKDLWNSMKRPSVLMIAEKLRANNEVGQRVWNDLHEQFKIHSGYTPLQIQSKKALEGVLVPMRERAFLDMLGSLPGSTVDTYYVCGAFHAYAVHKA